MGLPAKRAFGQIPQDKWQGAVSLKNYSYRAEAHAASKSDERKGEHPYVLHPEDPDTTEFTPSFLEWERYFREHLGGYPAAFKLLMDKGAKCFVVPEMKPEWFDPTWVPVRQIAAE